MNQSSDQIELFLLNSYVISEDVFYQEKYNSFYLTL